MEQEIDFESALARLEEIVSLLEEGKVSLEQSLTLYEEGVNLSTKLQNKLKTAEEKTMKIFENIKETEDK